MNYSKILWKAYQQFILDIEGKKVAIPYRINTIPSDHPARQGKSSPEVLLKQLTEDSEKEGFNLKNATVSEIRDFMINHKLGIDCSGFAYRILDYLVGQLGMGNLQKAQGLEHVGRTNVRTLTSDKFCIKVSSFNDAKPGDLIKLNSNKPIPHVLIILEVEGKTITYAHSSSLEGVHIDRIVNGKFPEELSSFEYSEKDGDGIKRLKKLNQDKLYLS